MWPGRAERIRARLGLSAPSAAPEEQGIPGGAAATLGDPALRPPARPHTHLPQPQAPAHSTEPHAWRHRPPPASHWLHLENGDIWLAFELSITQTANRKPRSELKRPPGTRVPRGAPPAAGGASDVIFPRRAPPVAPPFCVGDSRSRDQAGAVPGSARAVTGTHQHPTEIPWAWQGSAGLGRDPPVSSQGSPRIPPGTPRAWPGSRHTGAADTLRCGSLRTALIPLSPQILKAPES